MSENNPLYLRKTYCNPLSMPDCPRGADPVEWDEIMGYTEEPEKDYRSISDPSVMYYDNKWYLYPSYGITYVSEDFVTFKRVKTNIGDAGYSPSVIPYKGKFLMAAQTLEQRTNGLYLSDSPTGPFEFLGNFINVDGKNEYPCDMCIFADDDDRIYLYWTGYECKNGEYQCLSCGVELDRDDPRQFLGKPYIINRFNPDNKWERFGADNQDTRSSWIEGQWMIKKNGRYYLLYATPGTEYRSYVMAAYYSDEGPLTGFVCQKRNPVTKSRHGLVSGAGHGCIQHGPNGSLWAFYTMTHCVFHPYERRIGMDPVYVDENGELYCPKVTDIPRLGATEVGCNDTDNSTDVLPITFFHRQCAKSSSHIQGRETMYAFDESVLTWWQPTDDDEAPTLTVDVRGQYICEAVRIIWREVNLNYNEGILPGAIKYVVEGREFLNKGEWKTLLDMSDNTEDMVVDYHTFAPTVCRELRLRILGAPKNLSIGVTSFTVFGTRK